MALTPTPLIVETGAIVAGANTFVSVADASQYLFDRGLVADESAITAGLLRRGLDALAALPCLSAYRLPLSSVTDIPSELVQAQTWVAYYISVSASNDPAAITSGGTVKREKVDVIEREYMDGDGKKSAVSIADMPSVVGLLRAMGCDSMTINPVAAPAAMWV